MRDRSGVLRSAGNERRRTALQADDLPGLTSEIHGSWCIETDAASDSLIQPAEVQLTLFA